MAVMKFDVNHSLSKDQARERVQKLMGYWADKYGVKSEWNGDQASVLGKVMGINLEANFEVRDGQVCGEGTDPGMLLRGQAKKYIQKKFDEFLDPTKSEADLNALCD
ncbi:MAG TPA: polyhydroxyalkanoic acid system family protein [Myxococcaceae bacterium]|nr:polyhydroxyalkanoic acid system family protein [Myxococcaceae bacterium]